VLVAARADRPRDPEVRDDRLSFVQEDVRRLDVSVDHAAPVRVGPGPSVNNLPGFHT
jgi:hypothetical protein